MLGRGEILKVFEHKRAKIIECFRKINGKKEKLSGVEISILSLQKGNRTLKML